MSDMSQVNSGVLNQEIKKQEEKSASVQEKKPEEKPQEKKEEKPAEKPVEKKEEPKKEAPVSKAIVLPQSDKKAADH